MHRLEHRDGPAFAECLNCGFLFISPMQHQRDFSASRSGAASASQDEAEAGRAFLAPAFDRLGHEPLYMLDYECGHRSLSGRLRREGHRVIGVARVPPRRPHPDHLTGDLLEMGLVPAQFDLAYAYDVFDYLPEPRPVLDELLRLTRSGGLVRIYVDMEARPRRDRGAFDARPDAPRHRCSYFRPHTFEKALEGQADRLVDVDPWGVLIEARPTVQRTAAHRPVDVLRGDVMQQP